MNFCNERSASFYGATKTCAAFVTVPGCLDYLGHSLLGGGDGLGWILVVLEFSGEVGVVGGHVKVAVPGQVEENDLLVSGFFGLQRFVDGRADGVSSFWRGNNAFAACELHGCFEDGVLVIGLGL